MSSDPTGIKIAFDPTQQRMRGFTTHGALPFDAPYISEIVPGLWQGGCKAGLILPKFIEHVVSLYPWEAYKAKHDLFTSLSVRMKDSKDQGTGAVDEIARWVNVCRKTGPTLVHCQAGLNRSSLVVARALMLDGSTAGDAIALIREKRSAACLCNPAFEDWLRGHDSQPLADPHVALGASLLALRKARGWPLRELAARSGVALNSCSRAERGMPVTLANVARLAAAFGVSVDRLLAGTEADR
jgi:protein-tyrosine phosphatase